MRILVTGANGMLGSDLCPLLSSIGHEIIPTDIRDRMDGLSLQWAPMDITDTEATRNTIQAHKPDVVIHTAANTDVEGCEHDPDSAFRINALGTWNVAAVCGPSAIRLIYISTDFVFDGTKGEAYTEFDSPNPINQYGASKLAGERFVEQLCPKHIIVRTAWLFGRHGPCFPNRIIDLAQSRVELPVVADQIGSPTHTLDLCKKISCLLDTSLFGVYHITNSGSCSWFDLASETLLLAGIGSMEVKPIPASQYASTTPRPAHAVLRHFVLELQSQDDLQPWRSALAEFIKLRTSAS